MKYLHLFLIVLFIAPIHSFGSTKILFLGDSITSGQGVMREQAYPSIIDKMLREKGYKVKVFNGSISGSTTASALSRLKWFKRLKVDLLVLALGANDGLRGFPVLKMKSNLDETIVFALKNGMKVILAGMKMPPNYGPSYTKKFEAVYYELAKKHKVVFMPFLLEGVGGNPKLNQADGIHPNSKGQLIIAENVLKCILEAIRNNQE